METPSERLQRKQQRICKGPESPPDRLHRKKLEAGMIDPEMPRPRQAPHQFSMPISSYSPPVSTLWYLFGW